MYIHDITSPKAVIPKAKRRGRGNASRGNYSGRGCKGQKARSGASHRLTFEGGQTPLFKKLAKNKGFKPYYKLQEDRIVINLSTLEQDDRIVSGDVISREFFEDLGYVKGKQTIKILGKGELTKKLTCSSSEGLFFSSSAQKAIAFDQNQEVSVEDNNKKDTDTVQKESDGER